MTKQILDDQMKKEAEQVNIQKAQAEEQKEALERREYSLQHMEAKVKEYEQILIDISAYDVFVKSKLEDLGILVGTSESSDE